MSISREKAEKASALIRQALLRNADSLFGPDVRSINFSLKLRADNGECRVVLMTPVPVLEVESGK